MDKCKIAGINQPKIQEDLTCAEDFLSCAQQCLDEESVISQLKFLGQYAEGQDFSRLEIKQSVLQGCTFFDCSFKEASFVDVVFKDCDFSNSRFLEAYFERCQFISCKCVGCNMSDAILKHVYIQKSNWQYSYLDQSKLTNVALLEVDFTEVSISESTLKNFTAKDTCFRKNNFFKTMLSGINFADNEFIAPTVSNYPVELRGIKISAVQAVDLVGIWGIVVE